MKQRAVKILALAMAFTMILQYTFDLQSVATYVYAEEVSVEEVQEEKAAPAAIEKEEAKTVQKVEAPAAVSAPAEAEPAKEPAATEAEPRAPATEEANTEDEKTEAAPEAAETENTAEQAVNGTEAATEVATEAAAEEKQEQASVKVGQEKALAVEVSGSTTVNAAKTAEDGKLTVHGVGILKVQNQQQGVPPFTYETVLTQTQSKAANGFLNLFSGNSRFDYFGVTYTPLKELVLSDGTNEPVFRDSVDPSESVSRVANKNGLVTVTFKDGHTETFEDTYDIYLSPVYSQTQNWLLDYQYIDNISTGSGSWSNLNAIMEFKHTFSNPEEKSPNLTKDLYQFVKWQNDETGEVWLDQNDPDSPSEAVYDGRGMKKGDRTYVEIFAYWQPSVTVNFHKFANELTESIVRFEDIELSEVTVSTEDENVTFDGWYDEEGTKLEETTVFEAPEITKEKVDRTIYNVFARFVTSKSVSKVWDDADNQDGIRPDTVQVQLFANGEASGEPVTLSAEDGWKYDFTDLTAYDADGNLIRYTVQEVGTAEGYEAAVEDGTTAVITNSHTPETIEISVSKTWNDGNNADGIRPGSVTVRLFADGNDTGSTATLNGANRWNYVFSGLAKYAAGTEIVYTIAEDAVAGYRAAISGSMEDGFTITNSHTVTPVVPGNPGGGNNPVITPVVTPAVTPDTPADPTVITDGPTPRTDGPVTITDPEPPLASGFWALINLICAVVTAILSVILLIGYFTGRKKDEESEEDAEEEEDQLKRKGLLRLASLIPAIAGIVTFILTEDMSLPMQLVDRWTIVMVIILAVQVLVALFSKKKREDDEENAEAAPAQA
ncbi:MAG: Cna B-type domain-containing protein [Mogibacterium sp.]|nr:Cna B-type domain-containing protein [Mogibacterium sp.]